MSAPQQQQPSKTERLIRGAGEVRNDPNQRLWAPARWVVQMVQYLVAIMLVAIGESVKAIWSGKTPQKRASGKAE